jgi:hypothetical protein
MAGEINGTYEVILKNETDGKYQPVALPNDAPSDHGVSPDQARRNQEKGINMAGLVAVNQITPYITQAVNFGISQISMTLGSDEIQRKATVVSNIAGTFGGIAFGAATGGVAGAAVAAGMQALSVIISVSYNRVALHNRRIIEDENIALKRSRTWLATNRSRTGGAV